MQNGALSWPEQRLKVRPAGKSCCRPVTAHASGWPSSQFTRLQRHNSPPRRSLKRRGGSRKHDGVPTNPTTPSVWKTVVRGGPPTYSTLCHWSSPSSSRRGDRRLVEPAGGLCGVEESARGHSWAEERGSSLFPTSTGGSPTLPPSSAIGPAESANM